MGRVPGKQQAGAGGLTPMMMTAPSNQRTSALLRQAGQATRCARGGSSQDDTAGYPGRKAVSSPLGGAMAAGLGCVGPSAHNASALERDALHWSNVHGAGHGGHTGLGAC